MVSDAESGRSLLQSDLLKKAIPCSLDSCALILDKSIDAGCSAQSCAQKQVFSIVLKFYQIGLSVVILIEFVKRKNTKTEIKSLNKIFL